MSWVCLSYGQDWQSCFFYLTLFSHQIMSLCLVQNCLCTQMQLIRFVWRVIVMLASQAGWSSELSSCIRCVQSQGCLPQSISDQSTGPVTAASPRNNTSPMSTHSWAWSPVQGPSLTIPCLTHPSNDTVTTSFPLLEKLMGWNVYWILNIMKLMSQKVDENLKTILPQPTSSEIKAM